MSQGELALQDDSSDVDAVFAEKTVAAVGLIFEGSGVALDDATLTDDRGVDRIVASGVAKKTAGARETVSKGWVAVFLGWVSDRVSAWPETTPKHAK